MKQFFSFRLLTCLAVLLLLLPAGSRAQALTQADFTGVIVPQYMANGNATRLPVLFRATVSNLTPSTIYRAFVVGATNSTTGGGTADFGGANTTNNSGAGIPLLITVTATDATYTSVSTGSLNTAGSYLSFTTNAAGAYTGWFGFLNSGNARYTTGNLIFPAITLAKDATPTTIEKRLALNQSIITLDFATTGTGIQGASNATAGNIVALFDNVAGAGRPLAVTVVENIGVTLGSVVPFYSATAGTWNTIVPRTNTAGVQRVAEHSVVNGNVVNCASDADGVWPSGATTVNPTGGATTPVLLTATDAPLNAGCPTVATATVTATPATLAAFTSVVATPSATQTVTVGGSTLTADVVVTAPTGYEVSLSAATGFAASVTVAQTAGTAASTLVYVRLTGSAVGAFAGNVTVASTGATTANVAVVGTVTAVAAPTPTITSFTPATGPVGTTVTVTGTDFTGVSAVTLTGVAIAGYTVVNATTITFAVPTGATTGAIVVTTTGGTATSATSFTVTASAPAPTVTSFNPARVVAGSPEFTLAINGTNLAAASTVSFNGVNYTAASATAAGTSLTVILPATAITTVGAYPITVTTAGATSSALTFLVVAPATTVAYEDFEMGSKSGYATGNVTLRSGVWTFTEALLGDLFNDRVNQIKGVRVRGAGFIAMNFDKPNGAGVVTILAASYGNDTPGFFKAEISTDGGLTYTDLAGNATNPTALTTTLTPFAFTASKTGPVRLRFTVSGTGTTFRTNFDDLNITDFVASATNASKALPGLTVSPNPATDRITVSLPKAGAATVALRDLTGRLVVAPAALAADQQMLLPASLAAGVYLLEVRQGAVTAVRRVQKN